MRVWLLTMGLVLLAASYWVGSNVVVASNGQSNATNDPIATCRSKAGGSNEVEACLKQGLHAVEKDLKKAQNHAKADINKTQKRWDKYRAQRELEHSNSQWKTYRDAECQRRQNGVSTSQANNSRFECMIQKTQDRIRDFWTGNAKP